MYIDIWSIKLNPTDFVLVILRGYLIPFSSPPLISAPSKASFTVLTKKLDADLVNDEVMAMLAKGAVEEITPSLGCYSRLFLVQKKKCRLSHGH